MQLDMTAQLLPLMWSLVVLLVVSGASLFTAHTR